MPEDDSQRIYVWIDALSNYITGAGYLHDEALFNKYWPADVHIIGKDILRFHAIYWPAMLMSAEIPLPKSVFAHGFINLNDSKISKSIGNVVSPFDVANRFELPNPDPIRYYLLTVTHFGQDGNFTDDDFKLKVNADLANNLGNLLNRALNMTKKYFDGQVPHQAGQSSIEVIQSSDGTRQTFEPVAGEIDEIKKAYESLDFSKAAELIFYLVDKANRIIDRSEPWKLQKEGRTEDLEKVLYTVLDILRQCAILLTPMTPVISENIWSQLGYTQPLSTQTWADIQGTPLPGGQAVNLQGPVLPRLESEIVGAGKKK
ncbi:MAG: class I tRNA ligase family protein [Vampirovibrio sp.]|nr:class I tRNA ligase family protein [Vampirovibrio sp.]